MFLTCDYVAKRHLKLDREMNAHALEVDHYVTIESFVAA